MFNLAQIQRCEYRDASSIKRLRVGDIIACELAVPPYDINLWDKFGAYPVFVEKINGAYWGYNTYGGIRIYCYCRVKTPASSYESFIDIVNAYKETDFKIDTTLMESCHEQFNLMFSDVYYDYNETFNDAVNYILNNVEGWTTFNDDGARAFSLLNALQTMALGSLNYNSEFSLRFNRYYLVANFQALIDDIRARVKDISLKEEDDKKYPNKQPDIILE